jgi:hypothetical protein
MNRMWLLALTVAVVALAVWSGLSHSRINQLERDNAQLRLYADQLHHSRAVAVEGTGTIPVSVFDKSVRSPDRAVQFAKTFSIPPHVEFVDFTSHALDLQMTMRGPEDKEKYKREFLRGLTAGEVSTNGFRLLSFEPGTLYEDGLIRWRARGVVFPDHGVK